MIITTTQELEEICTRFAAHSFITVDTEFIREKTYYPEVCLFQIAAPDDNAYCVDPMAEDIDLTPLFNLFQNKDVLKVFHAARQDIEIIYHLNGKIPVPVFDTQICAMVCGFGENVGYQQLVKSLLNVNLDKSMRCTNWERRPLNERQVQYALNDVTYLRDVYIKMRALLDKTNRFEWIRHELDLLTDESLYNPSPEQLFNKVRVANLKGRALFTYKKLYVLRDEMARKKNKPRRHLIKDELLSEMAIMRPTTPEQLKVLRNVPNGFEKSQLAEMFLNVIQESLDEKYETPEPVKEKSLTNAQKSLIEILRLALHLIATQEDVAASLIASMDDIENFVRHKNVPFNSGWRYKLFGEKAAQIRSGEMCLMYNPIKKEVRFMKYTLENEQ